LRELTLPNYSDAGAHRVKPLQTSWEHHLEEGKDEHEMLWNMVIVLERVRSTVMEKSVRIVAKLLV
jgi:hypothetical protein